MAIIHAAFGSSADEAAVFAETFEALGGSVLRYFPYEPGATFWESQILGAADLLPDALVLPVPAEDIPGIAPQVTFFGLDTLGIRILGTGGWTDPRVVAVTPFALNGLPAEWGHTNWLALDSKGNVLDTYPIFELWATRSARR